jgi:branched-chain amino acid aminotransferase
MNVFFKIEDRVVTLLNGAILPGVTRESIIALLADDGVAVEERPVTIDEVVSAFDDGTMQEVFITGTAAGVLPVVRLNFKGRDLKLAEKGPGPTTRRLYDELTGIQYGRFEDRHGWNRIIVE